MQETVVFSRLVKADHTLDESRIAERTPIYVSPNGKTVERFSVDLEHGRQSRYIFKPLTQLELIGRERWAQTYLLPAMNFRYPRLLAEAAHQDPAAYWIILEDMGSLSHCWSRDVLFRAMKHIYSWQRLSPGLIPSSFHAQKPRFPEVASILASRRRHTSALLTALGVSEQEIRLLYGMVQKSGKLSGEQVVSHGDLHIGNVAIQEDEILFLDWEHIHVNSVYWDLYCLLDMTHPFYRRPPNEIGRYDLLGLYADERNKEDGEREGFFAEYDIFASVYSAWLLLLIDHDLKNGVWEPSHLKMQQTETLAVLQSCLNHHGEGNF